MRARAPSACMWAASGQGTWHRRPSRIGGSTCMTLCVRVLRCLCCRGAAVEIILDVTCTRGARRRNSQLRLPVPTRGRSLERRCRASRATRERTWRSRERRCCALAAARQETHALHATATGHGLRTRAYSERATRSCPAACTRLAGKYYASHSHADVLVASRNAHESRGPALPGAHTTS